MFGAKLNTAYSPPSTRSSSTSSSADLVIGAVLVPGAAAPKLVTARRCSRRCGRARCWSTSPSTRAAASRPATPTTHADPTYVVDGVVHYCVANMPGAVARTSTFALNNATLPFALALADKGYRQAPAPTTRICATASTSTTGKLTYKAVADALKLKYTPAQEALGV